MPGRSPAPGQVAQLVEHAAENRGVGSSILPLATPAHSARPEPVTNADEARACADDLLTRLIRVWLANRGVWEAIVGAGPVVPAPRGTMMWMRTWWPGTSCCSASLADRDQFMISRLRTSAQRVNTPW